MRHIGQYSAASTPTLAQLFTACTPERRAGIAALLPSVTAASLQYLNAVPDLHELNPIGLDEVSGDALIDAYDNRTAEIKRSLAAMQVSLSPAHADLCPYCTLDSGAELDHYLPKAVFPEYSLFGPNLLPICARCNKFKGNAVADSQGRRQFLLLSHDLADDACVLEAELRFVGEAHLRYYVDDGGALPNAELNLVKRHFVRLNLAARYARRGNSYLAALKLNLAGKPQARITKVVLDGASNAEQTEPTNSWRGALYRELEDRIDEVVVWLT